jgi:uncharacterized protein YqhQ
MKQKKIEKYEAKIDDFLATNKWIILFILGILIFVILPVILKN